MRQEASESQIFDGDGEQACILVVEDDEAFRELLILGLGCEGFRVRGAENGATAMALMDELKPDLVLLDMLMPVMDGQKFLRWLKGEQRLEMPVLVLTCLDQRSFVLDTLLAGASDVMVKPVSLELLVEKVRGLLAT